MRDTRSLIDSLSSQATPLQPLPSPRSLAWRLLAVIGLYGFATLLILGVRPDLAEQWPRVLFSLELALLAFITLSALIAAIYIAYPDQYQHRSGWRRPFYGCLLLAVVLTLQAVLPADPSAVLPPNQPHGWECTLCIGTVAILPAALLLVLIHRGATVHPLLAGSLSILAATATGSLSLRLSEANDSVSHLFLWHYVPTFLFSALGAVLGKIFLKW